MSIRRQRRNFFAFLSVIILIIFGSISASAQDDAPIEQEAIIQQDALLVASIVNNEIVGFDTTTGEFLGVFGEASAAASGLDTPAGMTVSPYDGNLYVSSRGTGQIKVYNANGQFVRNFPAPEVVGSNGINFANYFWNGQVIPTMLVADQNAGVVRGYGVQGAFADQYLGEIGGGIVQNPTDVTAGPGGYIYIADGTLNTVFAFEAETGIQVQAGNWVDFAASGLQAPLDIVFNGLGQMFVTSSGTNSVKVYENPQLGNAYLGDYVVAGSNGLQGANSLLVNDGLLYVSGETGDHIKRYEVNTGTPVDTFVPNGGVDGPTDMAIYTQTFWVPDPVPVVETPEPTTPDFVAVTEIDIRITTSLTSSIVTGYTGSGEQVSANVNATVIEHTTSQGQAAIGNQFVLQQEIVFAIDIYAFEVGTNRTVVEFEEEFTVCMLGTGSVIFLDASGTPRQPAWLTVAYVEQYTCTNIRRAGTLVLTETGESTVVEASVLTTATTVTLTNTQVAVVPLTTCRVTTTAILNLRRLPTTASEVLALVPFDITLTAIERFGNWYRVIFEDGNGWISGSYVTTAGNCS